jgi:hypothetical protein
MAHGTAKIASSWPKDGGEGAGEGSVSPLLSFPQEVFSLSTPITRVKVSFLSQLSNTVL